MKANLIALLALATSNAATLTQLNSGSGPVDAPAPEADPAHNPAHNDRTGQYSPKDNMHTGFEGNSSPKPSTTSSYSFNDDTTGGHAGVNRIPNPYAQADFTLGNPIHKGQ